MGAASNSELAFSSLPDWWNAFVPESADRKSWGTVGDDAAVSTCDATSEVVPRRQRTEVQAEAMLAAACSGYSGTIVVVFELDQDRSSRLLG